MLHFTSIVLALLTTFSIVNGTDLNRNLLSFTTIARGQYSGVKVVVADSFRKETSLKFFSLWKSHKSSYNQQNDQPKIDFETNMIIAIFRGEQNTGGYDIQIKTIEESDAEIIVWGELLDPEDGTILTQAFTQPHHIVSIKKSDKPIRYKMERLGQRKHVPTFILGFEKGADFEAQVEEIKNMEVVKNVQVFESIRAVFIYFDSNQITAKGAYDSLLGIKGVEYIETDPPGAYEENSNEEIKNDYICEEGHSWYTNKKSFVV